MVDGIIIFQYNMVIVNDKGNKMPAITAKQFAEDILNYMDKAVIETMPNATEAEREEAKVAVLNAFAGQMFTAKMG